MSDLIEELRLIGCHQNGDARCTCGIGMDAADEIARLRAELAAAEARVYRACAEEAERMSRVPEFSGMESPGHSDGFHAALSEMAAWCRERAGA